MRCATACASITMCNVMKLLQKVTEALRKHYGAIWDVTDPLWNRCEALLNVTEALLSIAEHYRSIMEGYGSNITPLWNVAWRC